MTEPDDAVFVRIGPREIYDKLELVHADVQALKRESADTRSDVDRHDDRLTTIERWRYGIGAALLTAITSVGITAARSIGA